METDIAAWVTVVSLTCGLVPVELISVPKLEPGEPGVNVCSPSNQQEQGVESSRGYTPSSRLTWA